MFDRDPALFTDLYTITMARSFYKRGRNEQVTFEVFVRNLPAEHGFLMVAGIPQVIDYLQSLRFTEKDLDFLREQDQLDEDFVDYLRGVRFTGSVWALPEGTVIPAQAPILRITAPRIEATLIESAVLSIINFSTRIATNAARAVIAADGRDLFDFSLRRLDGPDGALTVARSSYLAGFAGTASVIAGREYGIPVAGTMAHHYVMSYGEDAEQQAFEDFLNDYPDGSTLLIDTYDTLCGVERAMNASEATGVALRAVRLDSGNLTELAKHVRLRLDARGFTATRIVASNDLTAELIEQMIADDAPIDAFGMGTKLRGGVLGGVMKICEQHQPGLARYIMKKAPGKQTDPGSHQIFRRDGIYTLALTSELLEGQELMGAIMKAGSVYGHLPTLQEARQHAARELAVLPEQARRLHEPQPLSLQRSDKLWQLRRDLGDRLAEEMVAPVNPDLIKETT